MEITGIVELLKKDKKGLKLVEEDWYSSWNDEVNCNPGDEVKITFDQNTKDDRTFNNFTKIEVIGKSTQPILSKALVDNSKVASMLVSYAKDLTVTQMEKSGAVMDVKNVFPVAMDIVIEAYKKTKQEL